MKIRLLGTGGADGIPSLYSNDRVCENARKLKGKEIRTRSGALIDNQVKIDYPPDTFTQLIRDGLDAREWIALIFTHSHADHFAFAELQYGLFPFLDAEMSEFPIYGNESICHMIRTVYDSWPLEIIATPSFQSREIAEYTYTPIQAYHMIDEDAQNILLADGEVTFLYATDTGYWQEPTWEFLQGVKLDGLVIECTEGRRRSEYFGHLDINACLKVVERLRTMGTLDGGAVVYTTHHAHTGDVTHAELEDILGPHGIAPGYDGLEFSL